MINRLTHHSQDKSNESELSSQMLHTVYCDVATTDVTNVQVFMNQLENARREFGIFLKDVRNRFALSQEGAAKRADLTRQQWNRLENGQSGTTAKTAKAIADAFNLNLTDVLARAGLMIVVPEEIRAISFDNFSEDEVSQIANYMRFLQSQRGNRAPDGVPIATVDATDSQKERKKA